MAGGVGGALSACGAARGGGSGGAAAAASVNFQLSWIPNVVFAGEFVADERGYYRAAGVDVTLQTGGPSVDPTALVVGGRALVGLSSPQYIAQAVTQGAKLKIVAATFQKDPGVIMSLADAPIREPGEIVGKRIGIQGDGRVVIEAFCKVNGIDIDKLKLVPVGPDPTPLVAGRVDGFTAFLTNQPVALRARGIETATLLLADHGLWQFNDIAFVREETLRSDRDALMGLLRGTIRGWQNALAEPAAAARVVVDRFGRKFDLDDETEQRSLAAATPLIETGETRARGLLTMSDDGIAANIQTLQQIGVEADPGLFATDVLAELFDGRTTL